MWKRLRKVNQVPGAKPVKPPFEVPGFGHHYRNAGWQHALKSGQKRFWTKDGQPHQDEYHCGWWRNTSRRGGVVGRDHNRTLPKKTA